MRIEIGKMMLDSDVFVAIVSSNSSQTKSVQSEISLAFGYYGEEATRDEVRSVFGEWNIDKGTSFHSQSASDFDPNIMNALEVIKDALPKKTQP